MLAIIAVFGASTYATGLLGYLINKCSPNKQVTLSVCSYSFNHSGKASPLCLNFLLMSLWTQKAFMSYSPTVIVTVLQLLSNCFTCPALILFLRSMNQKTTDPSLPVNGSAVPIK